MDNQRPVPLNSTYFHQDHKSMDELRQYSLLLTMELQDIKINAQEELKLKDQQISQLKHLLKTAIEERDEAQQNCQKLLLQTLFIHQNATVSSIEDEPAIRAIDSTNNGFSSSDCDESIVSSPQINSLVDLPIVVDRPLPEKGRFLEAVVKAGPLLQTLLLAGPLPRWRHPPPPLDVYQMPPLPVAPPPVVVGNCKKRGVPEGGFDSSVDQLKFQRVVFQ